MRHMSPRAYPAPKLSSFFTQARLLVYPQISRSLSTSSDVLCHQVIQRTLEITTKLSHDRLLIVIERCFVTVCPLRLLHHLSPLKEGLKSTDILLLYLQYSPRPQQAAFCLGQ